MSLPTQRIALHDGIHTAEWLLSTRAGQDLLASCYQTSRRPRCMCTADGVEMYIARRGKTFYISRMPGTGFMHADHCESVEETTLFSGAFAYAPGVIQECGDGTVHVKCDLKNRQRQEEPVAAMSIDGLLDMLVEQSNLNRHGAEANSRSWVSVRDKLIEAARWITVENRRLSEYLFLPQRYEREQGAASLASCEAFLKDESIDRLLCAPLKEVRRSAYGWQVVLKHLPGLRLWVAKDVGEELEQRWKQQHLASAPQFALCLVAARPGRSEGNYIVTNMACLPTDANFLPLETKKDADIASQLLEQGKFLLRPLRFDCDPDHPLADFAIIDLALPEPVFVLSTTANEVRDTAKRSLASLMERNKVKMLVFSD